MSGRGSRKGVHAVAARGFTKGAEIYERARPGYPPAAVDFVARTFGITSRSTIVDLGAGTGKWTRELGRTGARIVAVEPLPAMRRQFRRAVPDVRVVAGTAELTGLPTGSADLVTVAQAFHWFDHAKALAEFRRILRPGGGLVILWNVRDEATGWRRRLGRIARSYDTTRVPRHHWNAWRRPFTRASGFTPLRVRFFRHRQRLTPQGLEDRYLSVSYLSALPRGKKEEFLGRLRELLATDRATRGRKELVIPYETEVFWCFREGPPVTARSAPSPRSRRRRSPSKPKGGRRPSRFNF